MTDRESPPEARCSGATTLSDLTLHCTRNVGHGGVHLASIEINGVECETGWRDDDAHAYYDPAPCAAECGEEMRSRILAMGVEAHVTTAPPLIVTAYEQPGMRCPHGILWFAQPTSEQIAKWAEGETA